ncbi:MAG: hypothetical protein ACE5DN_00060 [Flavobacteriales bacterium]
MHCLPVFKGVQECLAFGLAALDFTFVENVYSSYLYKTALIAELRLATHNSAIPKINAEIIIYYTDMAIYYRGTPTYNERIPTYNARIPTYKTRNATYYARIAIYNA